MPETAAPLKVVSLTLPGGQRAWFHADGAYLVVTLDTPLHYIASAAYLKTRDAANCFWATINDRLACRN